MSDATQKCPVCSAVLPARAKFCAECGTTLKGVTASAAPAAAAAGNPVLPWFIAGVCVLAVFAMVIIIAVRRPGPAAGDQSNVAGAAAQADTISRQSRTHLFGPLLKARVAEARNNTIALRQAYQQLLANWTSERAKNLPEYSQHDAVLNELHTAAQRR